MALKGRRSDFFALKNGDGRGFSIVLVENDITTREKAF